MSYQIIIGVIILGELDYKLRFLTSYEILWLFC
jgi:hypothetical protein